ncbi:melanopsin-like [Montipora capricornis]|uniref:melanopsin-like n=1 Tax=Montipora foliosa TaxID=591990 RepID=UPI0035F146DF
MHVDSSEWKAMIDLQERPNYLVATETTVLGIIFAVSVLGNTSSCFIMYTSPRLRTWHNLLLLNVIVVDLLATFLCVTPAFTVLLKGKWFGGQALCSFIAYTSSLLLTVSVMTLAVISTSRYFLITNLLRYMTIFKKRNVVWMLLAIWSLAAGCAFPPIVGWGHFTFLPGNAICFVYFNSSLSYAAVYTLLVIGLPVAVIIISFVRVWQAIKTKAPTRSSSMSPTPNASEEIYSARTLLFVVVIVLLCWFPVFLIFLIATFGMEMPRQAALIATYSIFLPSALKPLIYFYTKKQFRAGFFVFARKLPLFKKRKRRNRVSNI